MISSEVQRTLVKSPPELWAELSDPTALSRHLGELGDIRITRVEPEEIVEWEAENASGTVTIKASGWGTKVILAVKRELDTPAAPDEPATAAFTPEGAAEAGAPDETASPERDTPSAPPERESLRSLGVEIELTAAERFASHDFEPLLGAHARFARSEAPAEAPRELETGAVLTATPDATAPDTATPGLAYTAETKPTRRGFFARLFGRRSRHAEEIPEPTPEEHASAPMPLTATDLDETVAHEPEPGEAADTEPAPLAAAQIETAALEVPQTEAGKIAAAEAKAPTATPGASPRAPAEESPQKAGEPARGDLAAELRAAEEAAVAEVEAVLTAVLDRLGAAHHRPFSRA
ncbi:MAG TPA: hypothetical protein VKG82_09875 [Solirubrobacteraceae bacterium]|nr:hypothetical protein [Solirubrobacteraceae bacterium]